MLSEITPMILTFNEEVNIRRTLQQLCWARRILIVDSFSTDRTVEVAREFAQVEIVQRSFDTFADQCNFGLSVIDTSWVLSLDADYLLSNELVAELSTLSCPADVHGFVARFQYRVCGRQLRRSLYPARTVLYRRSSARYENDGHSHRVRVEGRIEPLRGVIYHDDRKPLSRWLMAQDAYGIQEAKKLRSASWSSLPVQDQLRRCIVVAPFAAFLYALLGKGTILDGWPGWLYAFERMTAELILSIHLLKTRICRVREPDVPGFSCRREQV